MADAPQEKEYLDKRTPSRALRVLVVDDDPNIRKTLTFALEKDGHEVVAVGNYQDGLTESTQQVFDLALVDVRLGDQNGLELVSAFQSEAPWMKVVVITAYASIESAVDAMKRGATDYIPKPFEPGEIRLVTEQIGQLRALETRVNELQDRLDRSEPRLSLETNSVAMQQALDTARKAAESEAIVLLHGESGTGKTLIARAIHDWSAREDKPFGVVSCPTLSEELLASELFGHEKGAFTGAVREKPGRIATCDKGTLFLDEIGELPPALQAKLLRFIQSREFERVGGETTMQADVRIITATNRDLEAAVAEGTFREDLYYRINVVDIPLPPLRDRRDDILPLARQFLEFFSRVNHTNHTGFSTEAQEALQSYPWPGNIRELRNMVERAVILGEGEHIELEDLPTLAPDEKRLPRIGDPVTLDELEELHIRRVLANTESIQEAAETLGIDPATLWRRRQAYDI